MDSFKKLPEGCIAHILSFTSPKDACRLSVVDTNFRSVARSDALWQTFLPSDYKDLIARALPFSPPPTTKDLFFHLADKPLIIDNGTMSFSLEKQSGRKCYMLSTRDLNISWIDYPIYWKFYPNPDSSKWQLLEVCWLEIHGKLSTKVLSANTLYGAYLIFKLTPHAYGMDYPGEVSCWITGGAGTSSTVILDNGRRLRGSNTSFQILFPDNFTEFNNSREEDQIMGNDQRQTQPKMRRDGWIEIKLGEYLKRGLEDDEEDGDLEMSFKEVKGDWKSGLIVEGIEIRPV